MRTIEELICARGPRHEGEVLVDREEAQLLASEGSRVSSGFESGADGESSRLKQHYQIDEKKFLWMGEYTGPDTYPVK